MPVQPQAVKREKLPDPSRLSYQPLPGSRKVYKEGVIHRGVRVPFREGRPSGPPEPFLSGFIARDDEEKQAWGRPVGLLQLADGSILVSDDGGNRIWRVSYSR